MAKTTDQCRDEIITIGRKLVAARLISATGGNLSIRTDDGILVTATGTDLCQLTPQDVVLVDPQTGQPQPDQKRPTCELSTYLACYQAIASLKAILHCHPIWTIGVVSGHGSIPPMFPEFVDDVESIGYVDYVLPTTQEMADAVAASLKVHGACIIRNHGVFARGANLNQAFNRAVLIEESAKAFAIASMTGTPTCLTDEQADEVLNLEGSKYRKQLAEQE